MATTATDIMSWLKRAQKQQGATHVLIVVDGFDQEDYPVIVGKGRNVREVEAEYNAKSMQRVIEVYSLSQPLKPQLARPRNFCYE
jgi:hypothetical protein